MLASSGRPRIVGPHHARAVVRYDLVEQPHLGGEIVLHRRVIIEVIAAEVGERPGHDLRPLVAELRQPVARCLISDVGDALAREAAEIGEKRDDIGGGQSGRNRLVRRCHPQRADRGRAVPSHAPQLPGHLDATGLAVGPGDRDNRCGDRGEEPRRKPGKGAARVIRDNVKRARNVRLGPRDHRNRAGCNRCWNKVLAVDDRADKRAEHRSRRDFTVIDRETGDVGVGGGVRGGV